MRIARRSLIAALAGLLLAGGARADIAAVSVAPVTKTVTLSRGESGSVVFTAYNNSDMAQDVTVTPRQWRMSGVNKTLPVDTWLSLEPAAFRLGPGQRVSVEAKVDVPEEAVGELAAMIAFKPEPAERQALNIVFSVSLYVKIRGTEVTEGRVKDFKLWKFEDRDALGAKVVLENTGNTHLRPLITVYVHDLFGKLLQKAPLKFGNPVYPGGAEGYDGAIYNFKLRPGLYKAVIDAEFTGTIERLREKTYFLVGRKGEVLKTFLGK